MNREIKFNAWLLKEKKMVSVDTLSKNKGYGGALEIFVDNPQFDPMKKGWNGENRTHDSYINHSMDIHKERNNGDDFILLQYTGLKDSKRTNDFPSGQEIYEGDIVKSYDVELAVTYNSIMACWDVQYLGGDNEQMVDENGEYKYEVIGNIYETPQLFQP